MLRTTSPNISVITNFGCNSNCWYCIWKGHKLEKVNVKTDWNCLENFLKGFSHKRKVSVSGGGDPLYDYNKHNKWWDRFFLLADKYDMIVDVHTREKRVPLEFWERVNRCVFSSDDPNNDRDHLIETSGFTKVRITHVVTKKTSFDTIDSYLKLQNEIGKDCQLTIKELVEFDDGGMYKKIRNKYPGIYHIDEGDYNMYYMPDNTVSDKFIM